MADAKLTALTAASALAGADLFYISQGGVSKKATHTQLLTLVGTTYVPLAGGTMTGALTLPAGAVGAPSLMFTGAGATAGLYSPEASVISVAIDGAQLLRVDTNAVWSLGSVGFVLSQSSAMLSLGGDFQLLLGRDAPATLAQRNGTTQQISRIYNTYTDASNYERLTLTGVAGTSVNITAETLGTGADNLDLVLTPAGTGSVSLIGSVNKIANNSALRTGNTDGTGNLYLDVSKLVLRRGNAGTFTSLIFTGATSANVALVPANSILSVRLGDDSGYATLNSGINSVFDYQQFAEVTAPSAPTTNSVRIYAEDNGAGKTRLMALFATGSAVQLGIEP